MSRKRWCLLLLLGLAVACIAGWSIRSPGYMDADYYNAVGQQIALGRGFEEPFLWNYLDDPEGIPHPSHLFWMPLTSILASVSMIPLGINFSSARLPFLLLTALVPLFTARLALAIEASTDRAWLAGLLSAFPGFFLPFFLTTDSFVLYAIVGGGALWSMAKASRKSTFAGWILTGFLIGLCHLTRTDGFLLALPALMAVSWLDRDRIKALAGLALGYLVIMAPWWLRNLMEIGSIFPGGVSSILWLRSYDDLFSYPAALLTPARWLESGLAELVRVRWDATLTNFQTVVAVNGLVFLGPFMVLGIRRQWHRPLVRLAVAYGLILLGLMSVVFPFPGARGGTFHSGAALMPFLWVMAAVGLEEAIAWGSKRRGWKISEATKVFRWSAVALAAILTAVLFWTRVIGMDGSGPAWGRGDKVYQEIGRELKRLDPEGGRVAVNNPPGFYEATGLEAVVIPNGAPETLLDVVERYRVEWIVLEANHPIDLGSLYAAPESLPWLRMAWSSSDSEGNDVFILQVLGER